MPASSLIFVVIVAIWAAYLLQHWVRRRENAAAARSVDGFTEAMRVLEKRPILPRAEFDTPRPRSYSVMPGHRARPTIDVKRAVPAGAPRSSPLVARRVTESDHLEVETMTKPTHATPGGPSTRPAPAHRPAVSMGQRRLRAALLLAALLWVPVSVVLAVTGRLMWVSVPFAVLTFVAVLFWLRSEARADRARGAADERAAHEAGFGTADRRRAARSPRTSRRAARNARRLPELTSDDTQVIRNPDRYAADPAAEVAVQTPADLPTQLPAALAATAGAVPHVHEHGMADPATLGAAVAAAASPAAYDRVFDVEETAVATPVQPVEQPADGTWSPVPVPTPTYAMKAKAEPRFTADGIPADVFDTPEFAEEAEELDDRALFARRAASQ